MSRSNNHAAITTRYQRTRRRLAQRRKAAFDLAIEVGTTWGPFDRNKVRRLAALFKNCRYSTRPAQNTMSIMLNHGRMMSR